MDKLLFILIFVLVLGVIYLLAIMPRISKKPDKNPFMGVLYAHRGLHNNMEEAPENSMKAFQYAVEAGYGIEMDIQLTKDKVPVVFHDFTLKRVCGKEGKVCEYTYNELAEFKLFHSEERIPRFEDVLDMVDGRVPLIIELKIEFWDIGVCPIADKLLRNYNGRYCIESFNPRGVYWFRKNHNEVMRGQLSDAFMLEKKSVGVQYFILQNLLLNFLTKPDFIAYNQKYPTVLSRKLCHRLYGNMAVAWTIKSQKDLEDAKKHFDLFIFDSFIPI